MDYKKYNKTLKYKAPVAMWMSICGSVCFALAHKECQGINRELAEIFVNHFTKKFIELGVVTEDEAKVTFK